MNLSNLIKRIVQRCSVLLVVLSITAVAFAGRSQQKSEPEHKSEPAHKSASSKPASHPAPAHESAPSKAASHSVPAEHPGRHAEPSERKAAGEHTTTTAHSPVGEHTAAPEHSLGGEHTATTGHAPEGTREVSLKSGGTASIRSNGQIRSVDRDGIHIDHGLNGGRTVVSEHNGVRVVNTGRSGGYVQRAYVSRGAGAA